jgi:hypothetical protein
MRFVEQALGMTHFARATVDSMAVVRSLDCWLVVVAFGTLLPCLA